MTGDVQPKLPEQGVFLCSPFRVIFYKQFDKNPFDVTVGHFSLPGQVLHPVSAPFLNK